MLDVVGTLGYLPMVQTNNGGRYDLIMDGSRRMECQQGEKLCEVMAHFHILLMYIPPLFHQIFFHVPPRFP